MTYKDLSSTPVDLGGTQYMWDATPSTKQVIAIHSTESSKADGSLNWMRTQQSGSYHLLVDVNGDVYRMVPDHWRAWSALSIGNRIGLHICAVGWAKWSRDRWSKNEKQLESLSKYIGLWAKQYGFPVEVLSPADVKSGQRGICAHRDISDAFKESSNRDPGDNFPLSRVVQNAVKYSGADMLPGFTPSQTAEVATNFRQLHLS